MHMILTSLSAIYQGHVPILRYGQRHVDQLSRAHLRYALTGQLTHWIENHVTYISDPLKNEDPEPHSKSYSTGGTEMPEQELVQKQQKKEKKNTTNTPNTPKSRPKYTQTQSPQARNITRTPRPRRSPPTHQNHRYPKHTLPDGNYTSTPEILQIETK